MSARQPVTVCIIVGNDEKIFEAIASIRNHVEEIVVAHNGHASDEQTEGFFARLVACTDIDELVYDDRWTDEEGLYDFAAARNHAYSLATQPWVMWIDSDDVFEGIFPVLTDIPEDAFPNARVVMPYEYAFDTNGRCTMLQVRERITRRTDPWEWRRPVHEGLFLREGEASGIDWQIGKIVHRREESKTSIDRNWRILKRQRLANGTEGELNARFWFDYGFAAIQADDRAEGRFALRMAIDLTDWPAEREVAAIRLMLSYLDEDDEAFIDGFPHIALFFPRTLSAATAAPMLAAFSCEALAKAADIDRRRGVGDKAEGYYRGIVSLARWAMASIVRNPLWFNPELFAFNLPRLLHIALSYLKRHEEALEQVEHLRAARPTDGSIQAMYWSCRSMIEKWEQHGGDRVYDVVFACHHTPEAWNWTSPDTTGIGGSETAVIAMARELSKMGLRVAVYGGVSREGNDGRVTYRRIERIGEVHRASLLIAWRSALMLEMCPADARWLWVHDVLPAETSPYRIHLADRILALSEWHRSRLVASGLPADKIHVTSNGIDTSRFDRSDIPRTMTGIYSSSPDRGLRRLLRLWPKIEREVEKFSGKRPSLSVFYGDDALPEFDRAELRTMMREVGAEWRGRAPQQKLAEAMLGARAWLYPTSFDETSCISAMEAQAAGLHIVTSNRAALQETLKSGYVAFAGDDADDPSEYDEMFVAAAAVALCNGPPGLKSKEQPTWSSVAVQWGEWRAENLQPKMAEAPSTPVTATADNRPTIHFFLGEPASGSAIFDPAKGDQVARGGGSRDGFLGLVRAFAKRGAWRVRAASTWKQAFDVGEGVEWVSLAEMGRFARPDVAFAFYDTAPLVGMHGCLKIASHHTYEPFRHFGWADVHTAPSRHSLESLRARFESSHPWYLLPNGVRDEGIVRKPVPGRVIYHTSPDRGVHLLLEAWPNIKRLAPHATLHLGGDIAGMMASSARAHPSLRDSFGHRVERLRAALAAAEEIGGVTLLGPMSRARLLAELSEAEVFAYPAAPIAPSETFSVSIMECCKAGIPVVTTDADSFEEIYGASQVVVAGPVDPEIFGRAVANVLNSPAYQADLSEAGKKLAANFTFEQEALVLEGIIERHLAI